MLQHSGTHRPSGELQPPDKSGFARGQGALPIHQTSGGDAPDYTPTKNVVKTRPEAEAVKAALAQGSGGVTVSALPVVLRTTLVHQP